MKILGSVSDQIVVVHLQVLLKGTCRSELKKVKHVVQYAVFAAYHLSLETSFLADEGASLPKMTLKHSIAVPERTTADLDISVVPNSVASTSYQAVADGSAQDEEIVDLNPELEGLESLCRHLDPVHPTGPVTFTVGNAPSDSCNDESCSLNQCEDFKGPTVHPSVLRNLSQLELQESMAQDERLSGEMNGSTRPGRTDENEVSSEYFSATETHQSILVSFSSHCVLKGIACERSRLLRIKFYGCFDKPLGRYLRDDLFDQVNLLGFLWC
jgi:1-phosphatidylinositol-3-phosphate 5-kinase